MTVPTPTPKDGDIDTEAIAILIEFCQLTEALELTAYPDPVNADGLPVTCGYGATKNSAGQPFRAGEIITGSVAYALLHRDIKAAYWPCATIPHWGEMGAHQRAALADLNYNEGYTYGDGDHYTLDGVLKWKSWDKVGDALQLYANGYQLGLSRRRYAEWLMFSQSLGPKEAYFAAWGMDSVEAILEAIANG